MTVVHRSSYSELIRHGTSCRRTSRLRYLRRDVGNLLKPTRIRGSGGIESGRRLVDMGAESRGHNEFVGRIAREHVTEAATGGTPRQPRSRKLEQKSGDVLVTIALGVDTAGEQGGDGPEAIAEEGRKQSHADRLDGCN